MKFGAAFQVEDGIDRQFRPGLLVTIGLLQTRRIKLGIRKAFVRGACDQNLPLFGISFERKKAFIDLFGQVRRPAVLLSERGQRIAHWRLKG